MLKIVKMNKYIKMRSPKCSNSRQFHHSSPSRGHPWLRAETCLESAEREDLRSGCCEASKQRGTKLRSQWLWMTQWLSMYFFYHVFPSTRDSDKIQKISTKQHSRNSSSWNLHSNSTRPMPLHLARCWWLLAGGVGEGLQGSTPWNSNCAVCNNCTVQRPSRPRRTNQASNKRVMRFKIHPDGILVAWNLVKELHVVVFRKPPYPQMTSGCSASGKCLHRQALMCTSVVDLRM